MSCFRSIFKGVFVAGAFTVALSVGSAFGANAYPVFTNLTASGGPTFGGTDIFDDTGMLEWDESGEVLVASFVGASDFAGIGIRIPISNGENGIDETDCMGPGGSCDGTGNVDIPNTEPVNAAIAEVNGGGKLSNGNIIRASVWMRSAPDDPATGVGTPGAGSMPQVEGIFKIEMWKEALSTFQDAEGPGDADYGDRIWDQDQQGGAGSFVDINGDGVSGGFGAPVTVTLNTESWTQMVVEYEVDDNPVDAGNSFFPWDIGLDSFTVADVEEVSAVFFVGDWTGNDFENGGSWWMDNLLIEVFADQAAADLLDPTTSNPAPPLDPNPGEPADLNMDGTVDGLDLGILLGNFNQTADASGGELNGTDPVDGLDLGILLGSWSSPAGAGAATAVPEPSSIALIIVGWFGLVRAERRHR